MPEINTTTVAAAVVAVLLLVVATVTVRLARRLARLHQACVCNSHRPESGSDAQFGAGFTYALVRSRSQLARKGGQEQGSWQWCMAFIPAATPEDTTAMPPWWAPTPPWDAGAEQVSREAEALRAAFGETSLGPAAQLRLATQFASAAESEPAVQLRPKAG